jgi:hypothetical protein
MALYHYVIYGADSMELTPVPAAARKLRPRRIFWNGAAADGSVNPPPEGVQIQDLGFYGNHELYITTQDFNDGYLSRLVLLVLPTTPADGSNASSKGPKKAGVVKHAITGGAAGFGSVRPGTSKPSILIVPQTLVQPNQ